MNESFIFNQIRKYNKAQRQTHKDAALAAAGIHAGILSKSRVIARELSPQERETVVKFLREFLEAQGVDAAIN